MKAKISPTNRTRRVRHMSVTNSCLSIKRLNSIISNVTVKLIDEHYKEQHKDL